MCHYQMALPFNGPGIYQILHKKKVNERRKVSR
jgi:hypothetical protein